MGQPNYRNGFALTLHEHALDIPHRWRKPRLVFVNSMSDLFHADTPEWFIHRAIQVMRETPRHRYQLLTKRPERFQQMVEPVAWPANVWMGVSVENNDYLWRVDRLRAETAAVKFLSIEPLLGPLPDLNLAGIDWVIVGGESGPGARPMDKQWVVDIRDRCVASSVPFFFKQWGGVNKKRAGRDLDGRTWDEMPSDRA